MNGVPTIMNMLALSWARSRAVLFPFRFKFWLRVLIVVWFAGAGIHGCSMNFKAPVRSPKTESVSVKTVPAQSSATSSTKISLLAGTPGSSVPAFQKEEAKNVLSGPNLKSIENLRTGTKRWGVWIAVGFRVLGLLLRDCSLRSVESVLVPHNI